MTEPEKIAHRRILSAEPLCAGINGIACGRLTTEVRDGRGLCHRCFKGLGGLVKTDWRDGLSVEASNAHAAWFKANRQAATRRRGLLARLRAALRRDHPAPPVLDGPNANAKAIEAGLRRSGHLPSTEGE